MSVPVEASDIAKGDFSPVYGTVTKVVEHRDRQTNEVITLDIYFFNGDVQMGVDPASQFDLIQGWNGGNPEGSIRSGLATDHAND